MKKLPKPQQNLISSKENTKTTRTASDKLMLLKTLKLTPSKLQRCLTREKTPINHKSTPECP
jgi:hypothetical protein